MAASGEHESALNHGGPRGSLSFSFRPPIQCCHLVKNRLHFTLELCESLTVEFNRKRLAQYPESTFEFVPLCVAVGHCYADATARVGRPRCA
jgi:hypothetical protein